MIDYLLALATVTLAWWISTGLVLLLNRLGMKWQRASLLAVTALVLLSLVYLPGRSEDRSAAGALLGFGQGLIIWAWLEMTYLMGVITGPRKTSCPPDAGTPLRFWLGLQTSLYHEISVIAMVALVVFVAGDGPNQVAAATCISLWLMRWSAKLNLFLGVRNYNSDWFPAHLQYLDSYTRRAPMNWLFPVSVTLGTTVAVLLLGQAMATNDSFLRSANLLVSALLSLAVLEHWFLMYPFGESVLWRWALAPTPGPAPAVDEKPSQAA
ncbi:putative photosynthetic complex assembly protein PuhE [Congregibacter variabilis]|uniref:Photosynthetic complex assembly protein PuhE n=1 Tax=Congregibacter variabilis TaxID=3081200 RepID=A0ABZ0I3Z9_9GAMM|nr:putative photosynthetic complex assembly protein PuhE [Congregibacter sp. IMCC43200]